MINPIYGTEVLLNAALWVAERLLNQDRRIHKLFKVLWFADLSHLKHYGRTITGDTYIAQSCGPVPSALQSKNLRLTPGIPHGRMAKIHLFA